MVSTEIRLIIYFAVKDGESLYSQQKQHWDLTVAQIMNFHDPEDVGNLISGSPAFSKTSLNIWKFTVHILLKLLTVSQKYK